MDHTHRWVQYFEEFLLGGSFSSGYRCIDCQQWVAQGNVTPNMGGIVLDEKRLVRPNGKLEVIR